MKLKASTLFESLIAMVILVSCLGISSLIFVNVLNSDKDQLQLKAQLEFKKTAEELKQAHAFVDGAKEWNGSIIRYEFHAYDAHPGLLRLTMKLINEQGIEQDTYQELISGQE